MEKTKLEVVDSLIMDQEESIEKAKRYLVFLRQEKLRLTIKG